MLACSSRVCGPDADMRIAFGLESRHFFLEPHVFVPKLVIFFFETLPNVLELYITFRFSLLVLLQPGL